VYERRGLRKKKEAAIASDVARPQQADEQARACAPWCRVGSRSKEHQKEDQHHEIALANVVVVSPSAKKKETRL